MNTLYDTPAQYLEKFQIIILESKPTTTSEESGTGISMTSLYNWKEKSLEIGVCGLDVMSWNFHTVAFSYEEAERTLSRVAEQYPDTIDVEGVLAV